MSFYTPPARKAASTVLPAKHRRPRDNRFRRVVASTATAAVSLVGVAAIATSQSAAATTTTLLGDRTPQVSSWADNKPVELGVRFTSSEAGKVTGVRFYKGQGNTGTHTGSLWGARGRRLATATFTSESASGWQQVKFSEPVDIRAGRTYVASYHTDAGYYAATPYFFNNSLTSRSLTAPSGVNGVYNYGSHSSFPTQSYRSTNYWVDVLFESDSEPERPAPSPTTSAAPTTSAPAPTSAPTTSAAPRPSTSPSTTAPGPTPTPTPTTASPAPTSAPGAPVSSGWQLTSSNTGLAGVGVDRTKLPVYSGTISSGQTLSMVQITRPVNVSSLRDVTFDRVWIHPSSGGDTFILGNGVNITVKDSDLDASANPSSNSGVVVRGFNPTGYKLQRLNITGGSVGVWVDGNGTGVMEDSYVHALRSSGAHVDGFTRRAGTGSFTVSRSRIEAKVDGHTTGAFFLQNTDGGQIGGVTLRDTLLEGIGFLMTLENRGPGTSFGANNVRMRLTTPNYYGNVTTYGSIGVTDWTNVRVYDSTKADGAGALIARP